jgi:thymidylate synthase (FAD)
MGSDKAVIRAARVSYGKGAKKVQDDRGLLRYLMRHRHTTPFEMCEFEFHVRVPMDCWRQWIRHRMASVNEYSTRYSLAIDSAQRTTPENWRLQSKNNKQGSDGFLGVEIGRSLSYEERDMQVIARRTYERRTELGVAREQARKDLPLSTYTEAYWKIDLHNLLHFLSLRLDQGAQHEIRVYAGAIARILKDAVPLTFSAFEDYVLNSMRLSQPEVDFFNSHRWPMKEKRARALAFKAFGNKREVGEFLEKLKRLRFLRIR